MVEQVSDFKETCSPSPPAAVLVVMAVGIEPRQPAYKPCLLTSRLLRLTRSCMSETYYRKLQLNKICILSNIRVRSATGSNLSPLGIVECTFELGKTEFRCDFIVCKNLTRPLILG